MTLTTVGGVAFLTIDKSGVSIAGNEAVQFGTVPVHPSSTVVSAVATSIGSQGLRLFVNADGSVGVAAPLGVSVSDTRVIGSLAYPVAGDFSGQVAFAAV